METNTLKTKLADALRSIKPNVTSTDKKRCKHELDISDATLKRYMNGEVKNETTAANMLSFFRKQVTERESMVAA